MLNLAQMVLASLLDFGGATASRHLSYEDITPLASWESLRDVHQFPYMRMDRFGCNYGGVQLGRHREAFRLTLLREK